MKIKKQSPSGRCDDMEVWKDIEGYEGHYQISNLSRVKSLERKSKRKNNSYSTTKEKILKLCLKNNYTAVNLYKDKIRKLVYVHRLVAINFIPNFKNKRCVNHIDGNRINSSIDNLEWCTHSENLKHAYNTNLKSNHGECGSQNKLTNVEVFIIRNMYANKKEILKEYNYKVTGKSIASIFGVSESTISTIIRRETWIRI